MTKIKTIFLIFILSLSLGLYAQKNSSDDKGSIDSVLDNYTDSEFKQAVINLLIKNNVSNKKQLVNELEKVHRGEVEPEERVYGLAGISKEYKKGMNGWTVAISGILVVFSGLILIALVLTIFNFLLDERKKDIPNAIKRKEQLAKQPDVDEGDLVAIATAIELYYRLYIETSLTNLSFQDEEDQTAWKIGRNFGIRKK